MADDPDEIYSAPSETTSAATSSFAQLRKQFEQKNVIPIKVSHDKRFQSSETTKTPISPNRPTFKPPVGFKPPLFDQNNRPVLPQKTAKLNKTRSESSTPPKSPAFAVVSDKPPPQSPVASTVDKPPQRRKSERESIFPPSTGDDDKTKTPLKPINGMKLSLKQNQTITDSPSGSFRSLPLPPVGSGPPSKPGRIPDYEAVLFDHQPPELQGEEPDDIYDDVATALPDTPMIASGSDRPVSLIPEMGEEEEDSDDNVSRPPRPPAGHPPPLHDQEVYDDVAAPLPGESPDEIYEDI